MNGLTAANTKYGHEGADDLIKHFLRLVHAGLVPPAEAYRYGGDEALVIMPGTSVDAARIWSRTLLKRLAQEPVDLDGRKANVRACIGIITTTDSNTVAKALIKADRELYRAKGDSPAVSRPSVLAVEGGDREEPNVPDRA